MRGAMEGVDGVERASGMADACVGEGDAAVDNAQLFQDWFISGNHVVSGSYCVKRIKDIWGNTCTWRLGSPGNFMNSSSVNFMTLGSPSPL